jgi:hypothetical protein
MTATPATTTAKTAATTADRIGPRRTTATATSKEKKLARYDSNQHSQIWHYSCGNNHVCDARRHRGRTDNSHRQNLLLLSRPSQQTTATMVTQDTAEEPTIAIDNIFSRCCALRNRLQTPRTHAFTRTAQAISASTNPANYELNRYLAVLPGAQRSQLSLTELA